MAEAIDFFALSGFEAPVLILPDREDPSPEHVPNVRPTL